MELKVLQEDLALGFKILNPAIVAKSARRIFKTISISGDDDTITMKAFNAETTITVTIPGKVVKPGTANVDNLIVDTVNTFNKGVELKLKYAKDKLAISHSRKRHTIACVVDEEFPEFPVVDGFTKLDPVLFSEMMSRASAVVGDRTEREILEGICFNPHKRIIMSGDGTRMGVIQNVDFTDSTVTPGRVNIAGIVSLLKLTKDETVEELDVYSAIGRPELQERVKTLMCGFTGQIVKGEPDGDFRYFKWTAVISSFVEEYPLSGYDKLVEYTEKGYAASIVFIAHELRKAIDTASMYSRLADNNNVARGVTFKAARTGASMTMKIEGLVDMDETIKGEQTIVNDEEVFIVFDPVVFKPFIDNWTEETIEIRYFDRNHPFIALSTNGGNWSYIQHILKETSDG